MSQIGKESVGNVDGRCRQPAQREAVGDARLRTMQRRETFAELRFDQHRASLQMGQPQRGASGFARHPDRIAGLRAAAAQCRSGRRFAQNRDAESPRPAGGVPADQVDAECIGALEEAARKIIEPGTPIAAMSETFTASVFQPSASASVSARKCVPSTSRSVETTSSWPAVGAIKAPSSPTPSFVWEVPRVK
jgi:hypothetical protein